MKNEHIEKLPTGSHTEHTEPTHTAPARSNQGRSAGEVWIDEAQIVPVE